MIMLPCTMIIDCAITNHTCPQLLNIQCGRSLLCSTYSAPVRAEYADSTQTLRGLRVDWQVANMAQILTQWVLGVRAESELNARSPCGIRAKCSDSADC